MIDWGKGRLRQFQKLVINSEILQNHLLGEFMHTQANFPL